MNYEYDYLTEKHRRKEMTCRYELPLDLAHFIILHAHNAERFGDELCTLTYGNLITGNLNKMHRDMVEYAVKDLKESLDKEAARLLTMAAEEEGWNERAAKWRQQKDAEEAHSSSSDTIGGDLP